MEDDYNHLYKIVLIGDATTGKTNILSRFVRNEFDEHSKTTIGVEFSSKVIEIDGAKIKLQVWDTAGQERFRAITGAYYRGARGIVVVFDLTRRETYEHLTMWVNEIDAHLNRKNIQVMIVGNKDDLTTMREVSTEEAMKFCKGVGASYLEVSAREGINIKKLFDFMVENIYHSRNKEDEDDDPPLQITNPNNVSIGKRKCQC